MGKKIICAAVGLFMTVGCTTMLEHRASVIKAPEVAPGAAYLGSKACADCHEGYGGTHMRIDTFCWLSNTLTKNRSFFPEWIK